MHIPDGFLNGRVCAATAVVSAAGVAVALRRLRPESDATLAPRMGLTAAFVFSAQMVNFPVAAGTSGHLLGAVLAAVLLGPHAATVAMATVFFIQAFFFLDGGHTALGANVLNMGLAGTYGGWTIYRLIGGARPAPRRQLLAAGVAAWCAVMVGAALTAGQLATSGTVPARLVFPAMLGVHAVIGGAEAVLTVGALAYLRRVRPVLLTDRQQQPGTWTGWPVAVMAGLAGATLLAPFASSHPDGLERVAELLGFAGSAREPGLAGPFPDYTLPGWDAPWVAALASAAGAGLMAGSVLALVAARKALGQLPGSPGKEIVLDARMRLVALLCLVFSAALLPALEAGKVMLLAVIAGLWAVVQQVPARWLASRVLLLLPFTGLVLLTLPALRTHTPPGELGSLLPLVRAAASLLATAAFIHGVTEAEALQALRSFGMPRVLAETLAFSMRTLRLLAAEAGRMLRARAARSAGSGSLRLRAAAAGGIVGSVFLRSLERGHRLTLAMEARGYRGTLPFGTAPRLTPTDWLFGAGAVLLVAALWLL